LYEGRYGPYVSDGVTNASLPKTASPDSVTLSDALNLIEEAAAKRKTRKSTARKKSAAKKKSPAKKPDTKRSDAEQS